MAQAAAILSPLAGSRERLWPLLTVSVALHAAAIAFALFERPQEPPVDLSQKPIMAKLVRLGPKKPEQYLPRKETQPDPAAAPETVPVTDAVALPDAAKPAPGAKPNGKRDPLAAVLNRMRREQARGDPGYGDPSGDPQGDSSEASEGDRYLALVDRALREVYRLPATISEKERLFLKAYVVLYIDADGKVSDFKFEQPRSGNGAFDNALSHAIHQARLPPPPPELRARLKTQGLGVNFHM